MDDHIQGAGQPRTATDPAKRHATRVHSPALIDVGLLDDLRRHAAEATSFARRSVYGPLPATPMDPADMYDWVSDQVPGDCQDQWDAIAWRQAAELALRDHDQKPVRQQPCPACGCWGLVWDRHTHTVVCLNQQCMTESGGPVTWTLRQLAVHAVATARRRRTGAS